MPKNQHDEYTVKRLTDQELADIFPEIVDTLPIKIKELKNMKYVLEEAINKQCWAIDKATNDEFSRWFWKQCKNIDASAELSQTCKIIARLSRQLAIARHDPPPKGMLSQEQIEQARLVPIESLFDTHLRRAGKNFITSCPLHDEKTPSMYIYVDQNRAWCFGCNQGGGVIDIFMLKNGVDFKSAVRSLIGGLV